MVENGNGMVMPVSPYMGGGGGFGNGGFGGDWGWIILLLLLASGGWGMGGFGGMGGMMGGMMGMDFGLYPWLNNSQNTQAILDKLCQLELDGYKAQIEAKNDRIVDLQNQLNMASFRESQTAQNAFIAQGLNNEVDALYDRLSNCPVPSTPVYGRTPIFTCPNNNNGCGCSGNNFYN